MATKKKRARKSSGVGSTLGRSIKSIWKFLAKAIGSAVRFLARGARDLDPVHQRDGVAFLFLIFALIAAAGTWFHSTNLVSRGLYNFFAGGFGRIGFFTPLVLLYFALRLFRVPDEKAATGRITVGILALLVVAMVRGRAIDHHHRRIGQEHCDATLPHTEGYLRRHRDLRGRRAHLPGR